VHRLTILITRFSLLLFLCSSAFANAQQRISGVAIFESGTDIPIAEALIQKVGRSDYLITREDGTILFEEQWANVDCVKISRIGYITQYISFSSANVERGYVKVYLTPSISGLKEITVKAGKGGAVFKAITELDIHLRPVNNAQEILRIVPGLFIGQHAGGGKAEQIFLRGFDIDHGTDVQLNVDGMAVNMVSHAHGQGYADLHFVVPELIENVQFNKGPYFADKGNFTTAGFVDFRTKNFLRSNFVKAEAGQFNTGRVVTGINLLQNKNRPKSQSLYIGGEAMFTKGYFESPQHFNRLNGILKYHGQLNKHNSITASVTAFSSRWNASGQIPERKIADGSIGFYGAIDDTEGGETSRFNANLEWSHHFSDGGFFRSQVYASRYNFELYSNFTFFKDDPVNGDQIRQKENRFLTGLHSQYTRNYFAGNMRAEFNTGFQLRYDDVNNLELSGTSRRVFTTRPIQNGRVREMNTGAYVSQKIEIVPKFDVTAALRADYFFNRYDDDLTKNGAQTGSAILSPKLNFSYRPMEQLEIYWFNGKGFHSNDTRVAVLQDGRKVLPPAWGSDLGLIFKPGQKWLFQTAAWYLWLDQEFVYVGDAGIVEAGGRTRRFGLDISTRFEMFKSLYADIDISVANPKALNVPENESAIPLAPRFTSAGGVTYRKTKGWNGSLRYRYMHKRPANEDYSTVAKGYCIADAAINYITPKWEAGCTIQNLFNTKWKETQFDTESRLNDEPAPVTEIHFTPGTPFCLRFNVTIFF
jgi:outer membrane cobalamin receptor